MTFQIPATWDPKTIKIVTAVKATMGGPPEDNAPPAPKAPAFKVPETVKIRPYPVERLTFEGLDDGMAKDKSGEVQCEWVEPAGTHGGFSLPILIYFHGGGFWSSSPEEHRFITVPFITHSNNGLKLLAVDYRLSPANPYPSPVIDALSVYQHLVLNEGMEPEMIFFGGDSAGGNLAISTAMFLRDHPDLDLPPPKGLVLISPWLDQHRSSPTLSLDEEFTACLTDNMRVGSLSSAPAPLPYVRHAKGMKAEDPMVSPIYDQGSLPPMMVAVGTVDRFMGECLAEGIKQVKKGDTVVMDYYEDMVHVFQGYHWIPLTSTFFNRANAFMKDLSEGTPAFTSVNWISIKDGSVKTLANGDKESVGEMQARLGGYLDRAMKAGVYKDGWKKTSFYKGLAGGAAKL